MFTPNSSLPRWSEMQIWYTLSFTSVSVHVHKRQKSRTQDCVRQLVKRWIKKTKQAKQFLLQPPSWSISSLFPCSSWSAVYFSTCSEMAYTIPAFCERLSVLVLMRYYDLQHPGDVFKLNKSATRQPSIFSPCFPFFHFGLNILTRSSHQREQSVFCSASHILSASFCVIV